MNNFIKTGDFADLANTTKRTLFYYDQLNLLHPRMVDKDGNRWYSLDQINDYYIIKLLCDLGLSLDQIRADFKLCGFSYRKLYKKHSKPLKDHRRKLNDTFDELEEAYRAKTSLINKFEPTTATLPSAYLMQMQGDITTNLQILDDLGQYFNNFPAQPIYYFEIKKNKLRPGSLLFNVGVVKEGNTVIKEKYKTLISLKNSTTIKSLKRTHIINKKNESVYLNELQENLEKHNPEWKSIIYLIHNKEKLKQKYLAESIVIL